MPIRINSVVHAGAKTHEGGVKKGFESDAYHVGIAGVVNIDPTIPAPWQIIIEIISFLQSEQIILVISLMMPLI